MHNLLVEFIFIYSASHNVPNTACVYLEIPIFPRETDRQLRLIISTFPAVFLTVLRSNYRRSGNVYFHWQARRLNLNKTFKFIELRGVSVWINLWPKSNSTNESSAITGLSYGFIPSSQSSFNNCNRIRNLLIQTKIMKKYVKIADTVPLIHRTQHILRKLPYVGDSWA